MIDSLIVTQQIRSFTRLECDCSRGVERIEILSEDRGESVEVLSKLDLLNCRK